MSETKITICGCDTSYSDKKIPHPGSYDEIPGGIIGTLKFTRLTDDTEVMCIKHHPFFQQLFCGYKDESKAAQCIAHAWCYKPKSVLKWLWSEDIDGNKELSCYYQDILQGIEDEWQRYTNNRRAKAYGFYCYDNNTYNDEELDMIERDYPSERVPTFATLTKEEFQSTRH